MIIIKGDKASLMLNPTGHEMVMVTKADSK